MKRPDPASRLRDMLGFCRKAAVHVAGRTRVDLDRDDLFALAMARLVELVGEAATRIPREEQERLPSIPWSQVVGMRNRLIHGYDAIDHDILWITITEDLPALETALAGITITEP